MSPNSVSTNSPARVTSIITLVLGLWVFASPWVYASAGNADSWNSWILGFLVALFALVRLSNSGARGLAWLNMILGVWLFVSPWVYMYTMNTGRFINSLCAGVLIFILSIYGATTHHTPLPQSPVRP